MAPQTRSASKEAEAISVQDKVPGASAQWSAAPRLVARWGSWRPWQPTPATIRGPMPGLQAPAARQRKVLPPAASRRRRPPTPPARPLRRPADYRRGSPIAFKYVKRGYHVLCSHGLKMVLMPLAAMGLVSPAQRMECCWNAV